MTDLKTLFDTMPQVGKVERLGVRPERKAPVQEVSTLEVTILDGLQGDHYGKSGGNRQVTLIQAEHLDAIAKILKTENVPPHLTRRNIVVSGINLQAFQNRQFNIGSILLEMTGNCHPCSKMEQNLGSGGYNAMRGHGGITAKVIQGGTIRVGDAVTLLQAASHES